VTGWPRWRVREKAVHVESVGTASVLVMLGLPLYSLIRDRGTAVNYREIQTHDIEHRPFLMKAKLHSRTLACGLCLHYSTHITVSTLVFYETCMLHCTCRALDYRSSSVTLNQNMSLAPSYSTKLIKPMLPPTGSSPDTSYAIV
jgi:hypothetical protein